MIYNLLRFHLVSVHKVTLFVGPLLLRAWNVYTSIVWTSTVQKIVKRI